MDVKVVDFIGSIKVDVLCIKIVMYCVIEL